MLAAPLDSLALDLWLEESPTNLTPLWAPFLVTQLFYIGLQSKILYKPGERALISLNGGKVDGEVSRIFHINKKYTNLVRAPVSINYIEASMFSKDPNIKIEK